MIIQRRGRSLYFKKNIKSLVWFQLYWMMFYGAFRDLIGLPGFIAYAIDVFNCILILYILVNKKIKTRTVSRVGLGIISLLLVSTMIGLILVEGSPVLYIWGFRNVFRFYAYFISCVVLLDTTDVFEMIPKFKKIFYINLFVCVLELGMGYIGDNIGGIFGTTSGCNGYLNLFMIIMSAIYVTEYLEKKINFVQVAIAIMSCFFLMAIAELKVYLFELPVIILIAMINAKFSLRKIIIIMAGIGGISIGITMLSFFFENSGIDFFTSDAIYRYMGDDGYTSAGDVSRLNAVSRLYKEFLQGNFLQELFGIGLGNASYSSFFTFFNSAFYKKYQFLHYQWFTDAMMYIETGAIGLFLFEFFYLYIFAYSRKINKYISKQYIEKDILELKIMVQVAGIVAILCIINSIYNSALSMDAGYMAYFILAAPMIINANVRENLRYDNKKIV